MKRLKALIKVEIKPVLLIGLLFLIANIIGFMGIQSQLSSNWREYLIGGLAGHFNWYWLVDIIGRGFFSTIGIVSSIYMGLIIILVFASFRYEKSVEVSRFLKSLPYTQRERCLVKIGVGSGAITIGMLVFLAGLIYFRYYSMNLFAEVMEITALGNVAAEIFSLEKILGAVVLAYVVLMAAYLFMVMVQYMISHRMAAIIIGILSALAPVFIIEVSMALFDVPWDSGIGQAARSITYVMTSFVNWVPIYGNGDEYRYYHHISYLTGFIYHLAFYVSVMIASLLGTLYFAKVNRLENSDLLMPHSAVRGIFMVGVSVCGGLSIGGLLSIFFGDVLLMPSPLPTVILFVIGVIISFFIAKKIAFIGIKKRKGVNI